jgi:hypothetical protein
MLYVFQAVPSPIIRNTKLYNTAFRYCQPILLLVAIVDEMERSCTSSTIAANSSVGCQYLKAVLYSFVLPLTGKGTV